MSIVFEQTHKWDPLLREMMAIHYSQPKGFVGRQLIYRIYYDDIFYGCIVFGSATKFLPGRRPGLPLNNGLNNIFYHIRKHEGKYPRRNFTTFVLNSIEPIACKNYLEKYGDEVYWLESLVELPRTGDLYLKAGYRLVGQTKGYTCKREAGQGTDSWTGKRVWDVKNLRPKHVFIKYLREFND